MDASSADKQQIRELGERWVLYRDSGDWERFRTVWHQGGSIETLWYQGPWEGYLEGSRQAWGRGMASVHYLCGALVEVKGARAMSRTNMKMYGRGTVDEAEYDIEATAQFCDLYEKRGDRWGLVYRCVVHIKDRMDPAEVGGDLKLDRALLARQPAPYRHLAYINAKLGRAVKSDMPSLEGPAAERLRSKCYSWLEGGPLQG
jgi:hypothetical protein